MTLIPHPTQPNPVQDVGEVNDVLGSSYYKDLERTLIPNPTLPHPVQDVGEGREYPNPTPPHPEMSDN